MAGYQLKGGRFMAIYLYVELALFPISFLFAIVGCTWLYCFNRDGNDNDKEEEES